MLLVKIRCVLRGSHVFGKSHNCHFPTSTKGVDLGISGWCKSYSDLHFFPYRDPWTIAGRLGFVASLHPVCRSTVHRAQSIEWILSVLSGNLVQHKTFLNGPHVKLVDGSPVPVLEARFRELRAGCHRGLCNRIATLSKANFQKMVSVLEPPFEPPCQSGRL